MAKITEVIDEKVYSQFEKMLALTREAQGEFTQLIGIVAGLAKEIGKAATMKDFEEAVKKTEKATDDLAEANKKVEETSKKAAEAEKKVIETAKVKAATMASSKQVLDTYSGSLEENIRMQLAIKLALSQNSDQIKKLNKDYKDGKVTADAYAAEIEDLNRVQVEGKKALTDYNLEVRRALKENNAATGSYDEMTATLDRLRGLYRRLTEEERDNAEIGGLLIKQVKEYDATLKTLDKSMGVTNRNVGNYSEAVQEGIESTGLFAAQMDYLTKAQAIYRAGAKLATIQTASLNKVILASGFGILIFLLGAVITYFTKFQSGIDKVSIFMAKFNAMVDVLVGYLGKLGKQIVDNLMPALKSLGLLLLGIATFNYGMIEQGIAGISTALDRIDPIRLTDLTRAMGAAADAAERMAKAEIDLERATIKYTTEQARLNKELEYYNSIADDATLSFEAQKNANAAALDIQQKLANSSLALARQEEALVDARVQAAVQNGTLSRDLEKQQADAVAKRLESETAFTKAIYDNGKQRRQIKQDELERDLDILIDGFDNQKTINEKLIANTRMTFAERTAILNQTKELSDVSFEEQIKTIQKFTDAAVDGNDLVNTSDAAALNKKIRSLGLSEIIEGRLLEIVRDRKSANAELAEAEADLYQQRRAKEAADNEAYIAAKVATMTRESKITLEGIEKREAEALAILGESYANQELTAWEFAQERIKIQREITKELLNEEIAAAEELIAFNKLKGIDTFEQERELAALKLRLSQETTDALIDDADRLAEYEKELAEKRKELLQEVANLAIQLVNQRFEKELETVAIQQEKVDADRDAALERVEEEVGTEREKAVKIAQIEATATKQKEQLALREKAIKERQFKFEKLANAGAIIGNTARAITAQLAITPLPVGLPLVATIAAIGAVQLAQALAVPIPEYYKGTKGANEGLAWVGERGAEMRIEPDRTVSLTPAKPTLTWLKKGTEIVPAGETQRRLAATGAEYIDSHDRAPSLSTAALEDAYRKETRKLGETIKRKSEKHTVITEGGARYLLKKASGWTEYVGRNI